MQPFGKGPVCEGGQSRHIPEEEYDEPGPEAGSGGAAAAARAPHETGLGVGVELCDARAARHGRNGAHPARLGDAGRSRRAQPQPGVHRPVDVRIRVPERRRPVHTVPARRCASGTRARFLHQRRGVRAHIHHVPVREPRRAREERDRVVARRATARVDMRHRHGIQ